MDATRLDRYARMLSEATTRRSALRLLAGGALGAVLARLGAEEAAAACVPAGKRLRRGERCCPTAVRAGRRCVCRSDARTTTCAGKCGSVQDNCGRAVDCGNTCSGVMTCGGGGIPNTCGCTPRTCPALTVGDRCHLDDGCGGTLSCACPQGTTCNADGFCRAPSSGCFVAGTRVAMADGTSKPIDLVAPGDCVLGRDGRVNRVLHVYRPVLGDRQLYAVNDGPFFVTAGHPIWSADGWKAVDPAAAAAEVPQLAVGRLAVGDQLLALAAVAVPAPSGHRDGAEEPAVEQAPLLLASLEGRPADPATPLYNLRLDGDHTYFANDLLVHNKVW